MKNNIKSLSIKIVSLISAFMMLFTCLVIPAAATENDSSYQPTFENLLDLATEYEMQAFKNGSLVTTQFMKDPIVQVNTSGYVIHFIWGDEFSRSYYDYILFGLQIDDRPEAVKLNNIAATYLSQSDGICYYKVPFGKTSLAEYDLMVDIHILGGELKLVSCYGVVDNSTDISSVHVKSWGQLRSDGQYYMQTFTDLTVNVPYVYYKEFFESSPSVTPPAVYLEIAVPVSIPYAESLSLTFLSPSIFPNDSNASSLSGSSGVALRVNGNTVQSLSYIVSHVTTSSSYLGFSQYLQTVTIDLTGVDLTGDTEIIFRFYMSPTSFGYVAGTGEFYRFQIMKIGIREDIYAKPWYLRMFYWIQNEFAKLRSHLDRNFNNVIVAIQDAFGVGEDSSLTPDQEQDQDKINQDKEDVDDQLQDIIDGLEEAPTVPDYDDTGLGEFKDQIDGNLSPVQPVFVVIFENPLVLQYVIYVFMFALGGFLLFGER